MCRGTPQPRVWEGVRLKRLLSTHQVAGRPLRVKALNDYVAVIPWADIEQFDPLLAWHRDGRPIPCAKRAVAGRSIRSPATRN